MAEQLGALYIYPVKGFAPMPLAEAVLQRGQGLAHDRRFAIRNGQQTVAADGAWTPCQAFVRLTKNPQLPRFRLEYASAPPRLSLVHPDGSACEARLDLPQDIQRLNDMLGNWFPPGPLGTPQLVEAKLGYWDHQDATLSLINTASVAELARAAGVVIDPLRFRGNLYIQGGLPWQELQWLGRRIRIGDAELEILRPIDRCVATAINPLSAERDIDVPGLLVRHAGHPYCGVYARVVRSGRVAVGAAIVDAGPADGALQAGSAVTTAPPPREWPRMGVIRRVLEECVGVRSLWIADPLAHGDLRGQVAPRPGQHLRVHRADGSGWRCYSISGMADDGSYRLTVKRQAGEISNWLHDGVQGGTPLVISGPFGDFHLPARLSRPLALLSNGIGITPMLPMLQALAAMPAPPPLCLVHVARHGDELALWEEVRAYAACLPQVRIRLFFSQPRPGDLQRYHAQAGRPVWPALISELASVEFYLCGAPDFLREARAALGLAGVSAAQVHSEAFVSPASISRPPITPPLPGPFQVSFTRSKVARTWTPDQGVLLDLAEAAGLALPAHCRGGACGRCLQTLSAGGVSHGGEPLMAVRQDQVLLCCAIPLSNVEIDA